MTDLEFEDRVMQALEQTEERQDLKQDQQSFELYRAAQVLRVVREFLEAAREPSNG